MASFNLSPIGNGFQFFTFAGLPLNGGMIYTYAAGTSTPQATYTTPQGTINNANPIVMNADGRLPSEVWLDSGIAYKFVLTDSLGTLIATYDNLLGINDITSTITEWIAPGYIPTYINTTSFSVVGDKTADYQVNRRIQASVSGGLIYGTILTSVYSASITTVTLSMDSTLLDNTLTAVNVSFLSATNPSIPAQYLNKTLSDLRYAALAGSASQNFATLLVTQGGVATPRMVQSAAVAATSGTSINFSSIPSWVKRITINLYEVSTNGTTNVIARIGTGGTPVTTGYDSAVAALTNAATISAAANTTGFLLSFDNAASGSRNLTLVLNNVGNNAWVATGNGNSAGTAIVSSGSIVLAGALDILRLTTTSGTDVFDGGSVNVMWEG